MLEATGACEAGVSGVAAALGLHPVYFARAYRRARGYGPASAIQIHRVNRAVSKLGKGVSLAELAHDCGFADQSHLSRSFRKFAHALPSRLRDAFA